MKELSIIELLEFESFGKLTSKSEFYKIHYQKLLENAKIPPTTNKLNELLYIIKHNILIPPICKCGAKTKFKNISDGYAKYCSHKCQMDDLNAPKLENKLDKSVNDLKNYISKIKPDNYHNKNQLIMDIYGSIPKITNNISKNIYLFMNDMKEEPKCEYCCKPRKYLSYGQGYRPTCGKIKCRVKNYRKLKEINGLWVKESELSDYELYCREVDKVTKAQDLYTLTNYNKRGRGKGFYNIDHKFSKIMGFKEGIPPYIIGNIINLEMLPSELNSSKNWKSSITKENLIGAFYERLYDKN